MKSITLTIGGQPDTCGICGYDIQDAECRGLVGLNGVLCTHCTRNIQHFTPSWHCIISGGPHTSIEMFQYAGYPNTPFYRSSVGGVFLDLPDAETNPRQVRDTYRQLPDAVQELIWMLPHDRAPDQFLRATPAWADDHRPAAAYAVSSPDEHPLYEIDPYLPRPYAISGQDLLLPPDTPSTVIETVLSYHLEDDEADTSQRTFGTTAGDQSQTAADDDCPDAGQAETEPTADASKQTVSPCDADTDQQATLTGFRTD